MDIFRAMSQVVTPAFLMIGLLCVASQLLGFGTEGTSYTVAAICGGVALMPLVFWGIMAIPAPSKRPAADEPMSDQEAAYFYR